ncbi:MAG: hypothetical protein ACI976_001938, partial [Aureispira sp.]
MKKIILAGLSIAAFLGFTSCETTSTTIVGSIDDYTGTGSVTQGAATTVTSN